MKTDHQDLARRVADLFAELPQVQAVALSGSQGSGPIDAASDIDLYIYTRADIPLQIREQIMERSGGASRASLGLDFWGPGDEWFDADSGLEVDLVYFDARWMQDQVDRVMRDHRPSLGYTTCLAFTVCHSQVFFDPADWFAELQAVCRQPYPEPLRQNIIAHNHPVLRAVIPSYFNQIEKAVKRGDRVSVNHRLAGLLASYFDIIFALNHQLHPGEKRLVEKAAASCAKLPVDMAAEINAVLVSSALAGADFLTRVTTLLDHLDQRLVQEGFS